MSFISKVFLIDTTRRAINTASQTLISLIGADQFNIVDLDWQQLLLVSAGATLMSVLNSIKNATISPEIQATAEKEQALQELTEPEPTHIPNSPRRAVKRLTELNEEKKTLEAIAYGANNLEGK